MLEAAIPGADPHAGPPPLQCPCRRRHRSYGDVGGKWHSVYVEIRARRGPRRQRPGDRGTACKPEKLAPSHTASQVALEHDRNLPLRYACGNTLAVVVTLDVRVTS